MDRLKVPSDLRLISPYIYLHSNMDRLKALPLSCPIHQMSDLHSNMDRLKVYLLQQNF